MSQLFTLVGQNIGASVSASVFPMNNIQGFVVVVFFFFSFRIAWFDVLAVQGTLKSLIYHHSSKASILWRSALSIVQFSWFRAKSLT